MTDKPADVTVEQLKETLRELEALVAKHSAFRVGTAIQALVLTNREVCNALAQANAITITELAKRDAETCQCAKCRSERAQA